MTSHIGYPAPEPRPQRILCVLPTWVGDTVMATPALRALRGAFPDARLIVYGRGHLFELLEGGTLFDEAIPTARGDGRVRKNIAALREARADLALVFPHSFRSAWEVFRARIPRRVGYRREGRSWLLTQSLSPHRVRRRIVPVPMVHQYLELVGAVGAVDDGAGLELPVTAELRTRVAADLAGWGVDASDRLIVLNPGASFGPSKIWPVASLAAVADHFQRDRRHSPIRTRVLILCGPGEEGLARELEAAMTTEPIQTADAIVPLGPAKALLERADVTISTDAGPRHMSVAVGTPTVVLMGPTDPRYTNSHFGATIVLRRDVPCGPCHLKVCPIDHRCMTRITPDDVIAATEKLLERQPEPQR